MSTFTYDELTKKVVFKKEPIYYSAIRAMEVMSEGEKTHEDKKTSILKLEEELELIQTKLKFKKLELMDVCEHPPKCMSTYIDPEDSLHITCNNCGYKYEKIQKCI